MCEASEHSEVVYMLIPIANYIHNDDHKKQTKKTGKVVTTNDLTT